MSYESTPKTLADQKRHLLKIDTFLRAIVLDKTATVADVPEEYRDEVRRRINDGMMRLMADILKQGDPT